jgi:predicted porin
MIKLLAHPALLALAAAATCLPAAAQSNAEILKQLQDLKAKVTELENQLKQQEAKQPQDGQWGMTPDQVRELNRVTIKAEAMEDQRDALGFKGLKIGGYVDPTFIWNQRQNRAGAQFLNKVSDDGYAYDNSYFGAAVIDFVKETESGTRWRLTLAPNRGVGSVFDPDSPVNEASVSIPITDLQTRFIAGQLPDWSGYEYLPATQNKLITHNLLFDFTLPTAYTGAGVEITRGKWIVKALLGNMNKSKKSANNKSPMLAYRVDYSRGEFQGFGFAGVHGKHVNANDCVLDDQNACTDVFRESRTDLFEFDAYFIRGDWTVQGQLSWGQQKGASVTPDPVSGALRDARWTGASALAAYKFTPRFEGVARVDYIANKKNGGGLLTYGVADGRNGIGPDGTLGCDSADLSTLVPDCSKGVSRTALSFGVSYLWDQNTTFKAEYRLDRASAPVFEDVKAGIYRKSNQLLGTSVVVSF